MQNTSNGPTQPNRDAPRTSSRLLLIDTARNGLIRFLSMLLLLFPVAETYAESPIPVIFDTDIDTDCDDVGAVACLHAMADTGEIEILATTISCNFKYCAPCLDALHRFYSRAALPLGVPKREGASVNRGSKYAKQIAERYPSRFQTNDDAPSAVTVLREALAGAEDNAVRLVTVGYLTNVADLLRSGPDDVSSLSGSDLVKQIRLI